jgi:hypothetical protein
MVIMGFPLQRWKYNEEGRRPSKTAAHAAGKGNAAILSEVNADNDEIMSICQGKSITAAVRNYESRKDRL